LKSYGFQDCYDVITGIRQSAVRPA
jgi:hypothetical protein